MYFGVKAIRLKPYVIFVILTYRLLSCVSSSGEENFFFFIDFQIHIPNPNPAPAKTIKIPTTITTLMLSFSVADVE